ncbi:MAG: TonB-dependent receptor [Proteobacteria bacterium]|nr:TonB-dependent receptor [Pseudomonadota bacterium]
MKLNEINKLSSAVRIALAMGPAAALGVMGSAQAQNADNSTPKNQNLETIVVTGSNIRRVDLETASPVVSIDKATIEKSGKVTLGDLVQALPSMAGAATNPNVNNGGGSGASTISLRGLGSSRSLLLINGHRIPVQLQDLNIIPASAVERIDVLNDGASAVYGSDAIAGVVNIITRSNYQGAEFGADYGISDHDDGARKSYHFMFGQSTDKGGITLGVNYNKQDSILASNRAYSHDALYKYSTGSVIHGGSSRTPTGRISLPKTNPLAVSLGCTNVTRIAGAAGTSTGDYRCYKPTDAFNYQAVGNYDLTPSERTGLFALGNYKLTDSVEAFMEVFHNKTVSNTQIAPVPTDALNDGIWIPTNAYYNPFGVAFGVNPATGSPAQQFRTRLLSLGNRISNFSTTHDLATFGLRGNFGESSWNWFVDGSYGKISQTQQRGNYINYKKMAAGLACTTAPGAGNCTPVNLFNIYDPNTLAALKSASLSAGSHFMYQMKQAEAGASGSLFSLPAGDVSLAVGATYRKEYVDSIVDDAIQTQLVKGAGGAITLTCSGPGSICSSPTQGGFDVKEAYGELLVPILKDAPFAHSLNLDVGTRYSKYSNFGSTNNWKAALEYRPIEDLLLRATVSRVFRAPSVTNLYGGPSGDSPTAVDPLFPNCAAAGTCQANGIVSGSQYANNTLGTNVSLQPEHGKSFDYGFVYDPSWLPGLSVSADYYRIVLNNLIVSGAGTAQTILGLCYGNGTQPVGSTCSLIRRYPTGTPLAGQIQYVFETPFNSGNLVTRGIDLSASYRLPETAFGNFRIGGKATYIQSYDITQGGITLGYAGHFDKTYGNFARWRALGTLDWNMGSFSATWQTRYIGKIDVGFATPNFGGASATVDGATNAGGNAYIGSPYKYGAMLYHNVSVGYNIQPLNTMVMVGIDNLTNKTPPIFYQNNVINANTDVNTYDTIGRYFWGKVTVKF